ncbi:MAG: F0F1 ATP synthase subunit A [Actinobacteria bacterium]|nr:F0F1 ATP synthase subunit A [Actinomycetota bacterium]
MEETALEQFMPYIVILNAAIVSVVLFVGGRALVRKHALTAGAPDRRQNVAEFIVNFFVSKARSMGDRDVVLKVAPFLATCFLFILVSNLMGMLPIPIVNNPPTAYFSVTLALAICAVGGTLVLSGVFNGFLGAIKHLFWPNPLQLISEFTDVLSLSLRLFGNIGGEHMTLVLVTSSVAVGIPLVLHVLGLIPAFVQALVFTLLTASFIAGVTHRHEEHEAARQEAAVKAADDETAPIAVEGDVTTA